MAKQDFVAKDPYLSLRHVTDCAAFAMAEHSKDKISGVEVISGAPVDESKNFGIASNGNVLDNGLQRGLKKRESGSSNSIYC